jgi:hypothetical protein
MKKLFRRIKNLKPIKFIRNVWYFRNQLSRFEWWDYSYTFDMLSRCLESMADNLETRGIEIDESRMKKVAKIRRAMEIIEHTNNGGMYYIEQAEKELGELIIHPISWKPSETHPDCFEMIHHDTEEEKRHNRAVYNRANALEEMEWNELWDIMRGQDNNQYKKLSKKNKNLDWNDWFDGTGCRGWWD